MNLFIFVLIFIFIIIILFFCFILNFNKIKTKKNKWDKQLNNYYENKSDIGSDLIICLKYINLIENEPVYLTWKYNGVNNINKTDFKLVLLPYKNKQNEFKLHLEDLVFLKSFYEKYNLYNKEIGKLLKKIVFVTSDYNINKDQYLELEKFSDNIFIVKSSLWSLKGLYSHLHIDEKNNLYFDEGIKNNIAKFEIEYQI